MKHRFRFFGSRSAEGSWSLSSEEWHHLIKVLRLAEGDVLEVCDGRGWVASAVLRSLGKHAGEFDILEENYREQRTNESRLILALGVLKPQTMDELLPMLVELGVDELVLLPYRGMERSRLQDKLFERWERIIVAAAKQCKAPWFMSLTLAESLEGFAVASKAFPRRYLMDPSGNLTFPDIPNNLQGPCVAAIGSEQGFADDECEALVKEGFEPVRFDSHILRAVTASVAAASLLRPKLI